MTYQEFKNKYNEKYVDYDGYYGAQCWDLGQKYFTEVLGLEPGVLGGCGLVSNMLYGAKRKLMNKYFDEVSTSAMQPGDVVIWEYGHIAIFDNWNGYNCNYLSQNPNPARVIPIVHSGAHAFRLKGSKVENNTTNNSVNEYIVKAGDTLSAIACKYGSTYQELAEYNGIGNPNLITIGQVIKIPKENSYVESTYVVKNGDCLSVIGQKLGKDWKAIAERNGIKDPYIIYAGQVLVI